MFILKKFHFKTSEVLQGDYELKRINLMIVFQVNCPGCFLYSLPLVNRVNEKYAEKGLQVLGLSTAFEDFEFNTVDNTRLLLNEGEVVGETKKALSQMGHEKFPLQMDFPVAFDLLGKGSEIFDQEDALIVSELVPDFQARTEEEQKKIVTEIDKHLKGRKLASYSFTVNDMRGTPSWFLFREDLSIDELWFGHKTEEDVMALLDSCITR